jgi:hypothetical protein
VLFQTMALLCFQVFIDQHIDKCDEYSIKKLMYHQCSLMLPD